MKPRPLIEWKSFWLGILVLVFLGWAWGKSMNAYGGISFCGTGGRYFAVAQEFGSVSVLSLTLPGVAWGFESWNTPSAGDVVDLYPLFPAMIDSGKPENGSTVSVAHWFIILLFLVPWIGFLVWRYRRQRKLTETNETAFS